MSISARGTYVMEPANIFLKGVALDVSILSTSQHIYPVQPGCISETAGDVEIRIGLNWVCFTMRQLFVLNVDWVLLGCSYNNYLVLGAVIWF